MYKNEHARLEDTKSTAYSFSLVGILGLILLILVDLGIIPVQMQDYMKIITTVVMGTLFLVFTFVGIKSFLSIKKIATAAVNQDEKWDALHNWFMAEPKDEVLAVSVDHLSLEESYYPRYSKMRALLIDQYPDMNDEELDYYIEKLYPLIFTDNK